MLVVGIGIAAAAVAHTAAAAAWSIQWAPTPAHAHDTKLFGVSCTSEFNCVGVGQSDVASSGQGLPLIEHWNGWTWTTEPTPIPTVDGWEGELSAVSCTSSTACIAVGSFTTDTSVGPLVEQWNGWSWSIQKTPNPVGAYQLDGVSCASSTACIAVGNGQQSFAERWDGRRWSFENLHFGDPQGRANALTDVSCLPQRPCAAVGWDDVGLCRDDSSYYDLPVLGFWNSGRWSLRRHPDVACSASGAGGSYLDSVSCASTVACTAVGTTVYRWDGRRWSVQPAPIGNDELRGVSCTSANACTAVGAHIYTFSGREWARSPIPTPAGTTAGLGGVSCVSREFCVAVGAYENHSGRDSLLIEATER
jgi:hypothetical protein